MYGWLSARYISFKLHNILAINLSTLKANLNGEMKLYGDHGKLNEKENSLKVKIASHCCSKWSEIQIDISIYRNLQNFAKRLKNHYQKSKKAVYHLFSPSTHQFGKRPNFVFCKLLDVGCRTSVKWKCALLLRLELNIGLQFMVSALLERLLSAPKNCSFPNSSIKTSLNLFLAQLIFWHYILTQCQH